MVRTSTLAFPLVLCSAALAQHGAQQSTDPKKPMYVAKRSDDGQKEIASFKLAEGLSADLIAAEPDVCNGVAFSIDDQGRFYVCETFRIGDGVFDNRSYMQWKDADLACLTVEDRVAKYDKYLKEKVATYSAYTERVRMLVDTDRNGTLDRSTIFADGFNDMADGILSGVLPVGDDVYITNIPKLWKLRDSDDDGVADERLVLHDGYGVHTSLIGHDMHGLIVGPDRRLYFSIGDRGFRVEHEGKVHDYPHEGAVLRCELDGSKLEVVHRGLRNPQELAFDQWGDLFTGDNNSDGGDKARLVQITPGADSGWRIGFQWLGDRGAWNREKMWHPRHPEQSAALLPPIRNFADGPSGLAYDVGVGLPDRFRDCFFLCDFRGGRGYSGIRTFKLSRRGAAYEVESHDKIAWNVLPCDVEFGPDGSLYFYDWVNGWGKTGKGRIYRIRSKEMAKDFKLRNNARLLAQDFGKMGKAQLGNLLTHPDRRIRQKAQFALTDQQATDVFEANARSRVTRIARLHAIWGLGTLARNGDQKSADIMRSLTGDDDGDVRAMAARMLGDTKDKRHLGALRKMLRDDNSRVKREAALAIAYMGEPSTPATEDLFAMLRHNDDRDLVLRHAGVYALGEVASRQELVARAKDPSRAVQRATLLALARQRAEEIRMFLKHQDEQFRYEAARAIYELPIEGAMQDLALFVYDNEPDSERIDWRAINAARMIGEVEQGEAIVHMAIQPSHSKKIRLEALAVLAEWRNPHGQCRVIGNWRPCTHPDADIVVQNFRGSADKLLADKVTAEAAANTIAKLKVIERSPELAKLVGQQDMPAAARVAALNALADLGADELQAALATIGNKAPVALRKRAVALLSHTSPEKAVPVLGSLLENASLGEKQAACEALGNLKHESATDLLRTWLQRVRDGKAPNGVVLDLLEAADKHDALKPLVTAQEKAGELLGPLGPYRMCLEGGDHRAGRKVFHNFEATRCTRCHSLNNSGGNAGPVLNGVGKRLSSEKILESLIEPSAVIAEGFGTTTVEMKGGDLFAGVITKDQDGAVTLVDINGKSHQLAWDKIKSRSSSKESAMPKMGKSLSKRQLRDLVAFLKKQNR